MRTLLMSVLLAACACAGAANPAQPFVKKFDAPLPGAGPAEEVQVMMPPPAVIPLTPAAVKNPAVNASGMPMVPASDPTNQAPVAAPTAAAPAAASALMPGKPAVAYATLAQAAKAGVDPLGEHKAVVHTTPTPVAAGAPFDLAHPGTWLSWVQTHRDIATKYALTALVILLAALGVSRFLARRSQQG